MPSSIQEYPIHFRLNETIYDIDMPGGTILAITSSNGFIRLGVWVSDSTNIRPRRFIVLKPRQNLPASQAGNIRANLGVVQHDGQNYYIFEGTIF